MSLLVTQYIPMILKHNNPPHHHYPPCHPLNPQSLTQPAPHPSSSPSTSFSTYSTPTASHTSHHLSFHHKIIIRQYPYFPPSAYSPPNLIKQPQPSSHFTPPPPTLVHPLPHFRLTCVWSFITLQHLQLF